MLGDISIAFARVIAKAFDCRPNTLQFPPELNLDGSCFPPLGKHYSNFHRVKCTHQCFSPGQTNATSRFNNVQYCWMQHVELVWPPCCIMLHHVAWCGMMLSEVWFPSNIWCDIVQNVFVLVCEQQSCTRLAAQFNIFAFAHAQQVISVLRIWDHYSSQIPNVHNSSLAPHNMLHSFGHAAQHHPTKLNSTMLDDVAFLWQGLY